MSAQTDIVLGVVLTEGSKHAAPSAGVKPTVSVKLLRWPGTIYFLLDLMALDQRNRWFIVHRSLVPKRPLKGRAMPWYHFERERGVPSTVEEAR